MRIAVDFDGTLVEHKYPEIGEKKMFAFETLRELQKRGDQLILWTYRYGDRLNEAVEFCRQNGITFYAINRNYPEEEFDAEQMSRKIDADVYIDDRNLGNNGEINWSDICQQLNVGVSAQPQEPQKQSFFGKVFGKK